MEWINVNDRLPKLNESVLSYGKDGKIIQTKYTTYNKITWGYAIGRRDKWFEYITHDNFAMHFDTTHWMPLPEPPKKE
jgi:hypothetical protein